MDGGPGEAPGEVWLRFKGVPLYVWREGVFKLLGDCVGQTLEVDHRTIQQEDLFYGRVKVLLDDTRELPEEISLWLDDIQVPVKVEVEQLEPQRKGYSQNWSDIMNGGLNRPIQDSDDGNQEEDDTFEEGPSNTAVSSSETELEDDDVREQNLKFKSDCATHDMDGVGWVQIQCNGPQYGEPKPVEAQEIRKEYGPFKGAHSNIDFKSTTFRDFVKKTSRFSWSPTAIYN